jgi:adenylate cyclase
MKNKLKQILLSPWTAVLTLALIVGVTITGPTFVESVKLRYFDQLITSQPPVENNIYTVNIDEATLDKYGQWPFKRDVYADLISDLYSHNAGLVVWTVMMPETDRQGGDAYLAEALTDFPVILTNMPGQATKNIPRKPGSAVIGSEYIDTIVQYPGIIANIPSLEQNAIGVGIANTFPEIDGVNRRLPLFVGYDNNVYPSIPLEVLRVLVNTDTFQVKLNAQGVEKMRIPGFNPISTDSQGRIWVDWSQKSRSVSAVDLPKDFGGSVVIVGTTAAGLANPVPTSIGSVWPQDMQAAVIGTLANNVSIERPDWAPGAELLALITISLIILVLSRWVYVGLGVGVVLLVSITPVTMYAYSHYNLLVDAIVPTAGGVLVMLHAYGVKFVSEFLQKQQIKKQFGTYLSPAMVEKLQKNPELLQLGGDSRELSIMFTDVRGFTTISEHYGEDVQGLTKIMNRYMTAMTAKIIENNGTLDKYIGDAQMAFWNAPLDDTNHANNAVSTALQMMESLDAFNEEIASEGIPEFGMGLGINTGTVVVGNMGSSQRFDYTCLGDSVNLAARLEGQSKNYGVRIVLGPRTADQVKTTYPVIEMDNIAVKGKTEGVKIYTLGATVDYIHQEYLKEYYCGNWAKAISWAQKLVNNDEVTIKHYYELMIERMQQGLPANWDGTYRATSK